MEINSLETAKLAAEAVLSRKANDVVILDLRGIASFTDFFVICSGNSDTHVEGLSRAILEKLDENAVEPWHKEGERDATWILLDYVDVVAHIFLKESREFYNLERLWADAPRVELPEAVQADYDEEYDEFGAFMEFEEDE